MFYSICEASSKLDSFRSTRVKIGNLEFHKLLQGAFHVICGIVKLCGQLKLGEVTSL